jgi:hypothetical protein
MSDAPKIVHDRLRAAAPGESHPDADVLSAFAEQALSGAEREGVMRHLARCGDCREVVALSLPPLEAVAQPQAPAGQTSPRRSSGRSLSWLAWPNLRWAALAASVVVVGSVLLLRPEKPTDSAAGTEKLAAQGNAASPMLDAKSDSGPSPAAAVPAPSTVGRFAKSENRLRADKQPAERDKSVRGLTRTETGTIASGELADAQTRGSLAGKANKSLDSDRLAVQAPAAVPATAKSEVATANRASSSEQVEVSTAAVTLESATAEGKLVARNDAPAPPIAKAKPPIKEEADLKAQLQKVQRERKSTLAYEVSDSALAGQKQLSRVAKDGAAPQWSLAQGKLRRSLDTGKSWQPVLQPQLPLLSFGALGNDVWAGGQSGTLFHSIDGGATWTMIQPATKAAALTGDIVSVDIRSAIEIVLSTNTGESWTTSNAGTTWEKK